MDLYESAKETTMKYIIIYQYKKNLIAELCPYLKEEYDWYVAKNDNGHTLYFNNFEEAKQYKDNKGWYGYVIEV